MTELVLQIDNDAILPSLKKVLKAIAGVRLITPRTRKKTLYDPATGAELNEETMKLIERVEKGEEPLSTFNSVEDLLADLKA